MGFRVYSGDFQFTAALGTTTTQSIGANVDTDHSCLVFYAGGASTPNRADEGSTMGYISTNSQLCFKRDLAANSLFVTWFVIECDDNEFTTRERNQMYMGTGIYASSQTVSSIVDSGQCIIVNNGTYCVDGDQNDWNTTFCRIWVSSNTTVTSDRYASTGTDRAIRCRYEVLEWDSPFNVYTGSLTHDSVYDAASIGATIDTDRSIMFSTHKSAANGIQQVECIYDISTSTDLMFRHYDAAYTHNHRWYVIEFPENKAPRIERFNFWWNPTTAPGNTRWNALSTPMNLNYTFIHHSDNVDGTGVAFMRAFNRPTFPSSNGTGWLETQHNPTTNTYDIHITAASVIQLPAGTAYDTPVGSSNSWKWKKGTHNIDSGMRATDKSGQSWKWAPIKCTSNSYYHPSGDYTNWRWVSGNHNMM